MVQIMRPNALKALWGRGGSALNGWILLPTSFSAEILARQGFDSITVDMQHGLMGYETAVSTLQAISISGATPVVRVPWNEPGILMRMCDAGADAIICPMVNTRAECETFVGACRYPPMGYRSFGPTRARIFNGSDYVENANKHVITFAMIETAQALSNLDEILATPGLDAIYVGPADLSQSLGGHERLDYTEPRLVEALLTIRDAAKRHGIVAGLHTGSAEYARHSMQLGFQFVTVQSDAAWLEAGAAQVVAAVRSDAHSREASPY
jgi:4-hydroxy-2-oxoheptanedioate aldolase